MTPAGGGGGESRKRKPAAKRKPAPKRKRKPAPKRAAAGPKPPPKPKRAPKAPPDGGETREYELGEDFLDGVGEQGDAAEPTEVRPAAGVPADGEATEEHSVEPGEDEQAEGELEEDGDGDEPRGDDELAAEEDELTEVIGSETQEWDGLEAAERQGEAERTLVRSAAAAGAKAKSKVTSGFEAVGGDKVTSGFKAIVGKLRFPLWAKFLTAAFVIVASVGTATAASLLMYIGGIADDLKLDKEFVGIQEKLEAVDPGTPQTILILGSDKRPEFKNDTFRGLSDTTMLLRIDPDRNAIALFSLPRDLAVDIPGYGRAKLNEAYANGGPELTLKTIQNLTDVPASPGGLEINHVVNVDFEGFARAVNQIGCVYIDVDRRYYHSNQETVEQYEEIDIQPGYQALCGFDALDYARFRHLDNDVVRAARQQDFLREARHKVPPEVVFAQRKELIDIFTEHTTSDIDDAGEMLEVLKLFLAARDAPVKEVHFEGTLGPSFVNTTPQEINKAVKQFLGIEDTAGQRGQSAAPEDPGSVSPESAPDETGSTPATPKGKGKKKGGGGGGGGGDAQLVETDYGKELAKGIRRRRVKLPIYYPTILESGTEFAQKPRVYKINGTGDGSPPDSERAAYKWVFSRPALGEYYGFMGTRWKNPPILDAAHEERELGDRTYKLYFDGDRLRMVAWQTDDGSFWLSNTLIQSLSDREMIDIAKGMAELPRRGG